MVNWLLIWQIRLPLKIKGENKSTGPNYSSFGPLVDVLWPPKENALRRRPGGPFIMTRLYDKMLIVR